MPAPIRRTRPSAPSEGDARPASPPPTRPRRRRKAASGGIGSTLRGHPPRNDTYADWPGPGTRVLPGIGEPVTDSALAALAAGPFAVACSLLVVAGGRKLVQPAGARAAIAGAGLPLPKWSAGAVGAIELAAGGAGIAFGGRAALAVALLYFALAGFAWRLLRRAPSTPCACLGSSTATVSRPHVLIDLGAVIVALTAASGASPLAALGDRPMAAVLFVVLVACCVQLLALTLDALPALAHAVKEEAA